MRTRKKEAFLWHVLPLASIPGSSLQPVFSVISISIFPDMFPLCVTNVHSCMHAYFILIFLKTMFASKIPMPGNSWKHTCVLSEDKYTRCAKCVQKQVEDIIYVFSILASEWLALFFCICQKTFWLASENGYVTDERSKLVITDGSTFWIVWLSLVLVTPQSTELVKRHMLSSLNQVHMLN